MKFNKWALGLVAISIVSLQASAQAQSITNLNQVIPGAPTLPAMSASGLDFTNVNWELQSGSSISSSGGTLALVQGSWDFKKFSALDLGVAPEMELSGAGAGFHSLTADGELIKNFSNFQLAAKIGPGYEFDTHVGVYGEAGLDINYNLSQGLTGGALTSRDLFTFVGGGIHLREHVHGPFEKIFGVWTGFAF